jgi:hypothetical protein
VFANMPASSGSFTGILAVLLPFSGVLFLVLRAPATRRLISRRNDSVKTLLAGRKPAPPVAEQSATENEKPVYRRENDPEIANFDLSIFDRFRVDK